MRKDTGAEINVDTRSSQYTATYAFIVIYFSNQSHHREEQKDSGGPPPTWLLVQNGT
jgi:hypothetical protein